MTADTNLSARPVILTQNHPSTGVSVSLEYAEAMIKAAFIAGATVATNTNLRDGDIDQMWLQSKACAAIRARGVAE